MYLYSSKEICLNISDKKSVIEFMHSCMLSILYQQLKKIYIFILILRNLKGKNNKDFLINQL